MRTIRRGYTHGDQHECNEATIRAALVSALRASTRIGEFGDKPGAFHHRLAEIAAAGAPLTVLLSGPGLAPGAICPCCGASNPRDLDITRVYPSGIGFHTVLVGGHPTSTVICAPCAASGILDPHTTAAGDRRNR